MLDTGGQRDLWRVRPSSRAQPRNQGMVGDGGIDYFHFGLTNIV